MMANLIDRLGPVVWTYLTSHANAEPMESCRPPALAPWMGRSPLKQGHDNLADWEYIARFEAHPVEERPYSMGIGLAGERPVGFVELYDPSPGACAAGLSRLVAAGSDHLVTVCQPTPGAVLHVRSLAASRWWERAAEATGIPVMHAFHGPETGRPLPFAWPPAAPLAAASATPLTMLCNPTLTPEQLQAAQRLQYNPEAPVRYVALLEGWPVGVASVQYGPLGSYGEDGDAHWSIGAGDRVCLIKWASSLLMGWGIGSLIYAQIEADAQMKGLSAVVLEAAPFTTTDRFWRGLGFHMVDRDWRTPYRYMEKALHPMDRPAPISA